MFMLFTLVATAIFVVISSMFIYRAQTKGKLGEAEPPSSLPEPTKLGKKLISALPHDVIFPQESDLFRQSAKSYWAQQACEVIPSCVIRPQDVQQLSAAIRIVKDEYDEQEKLAAGVKTQGLFAVRGGGHSPVSGAASIEGGVVIDMCRFSEVTLSDDRSSVIIGAGARWAQVSGFLDERGLAVVGGRNSNVGVGGLTLGGGLSFFSPRLGLTCSNIISYEIVLASGSITTASASSNPDLWKALKGGSNNFGIVTQFTARCFPSSKIWSGFLYLPAFQSTKVLAAFHDYVSRTDSGEPSTRYDDHAAGPLACFTYLSKPRIEIISVNLVYTKIPENVKKWPACWGTSSFRSLWRFWSTCKVRTLTSATDEMNALNPAGRRQEMATTTIKNDPETLAATHAAYRDAIAAIRGGNVKDVSWTMVLMPLLPKWVRKGDANPLGLDNGIDDPLVIVDFTVNWPEKKDDEFMIRTTRNAVEQIDAFAARHKTGHPYRYLNYCAKWQRPFEGYGEENWRFLKGVSRKYDPDGLFQRGCVGGFKLDVDERS